MTWEEWVNSEYNPGDFVISSIVIKDNQFSCYLSLDGNPVRPEHVIEAEQSYIIYFGGGSN